MNELQTDNTIAPVEWPPHVVVATVVEQNGKFLLVHEEDDGRAVYNQPAGHWDLGESLLQAAVRETLEETGWEVKLDYLVGQYIHTAPHNGITYFRTAFAAQPLKQTTSELDSEIIEAVWLTYEEIKAKEAFMRSPMVIQVIDDYLAGKHYPLSLIKQINQHEC